jgi:hypothetical protein
LTRAAPPGYADEAVASGDAPTVAFAAVSQEQAEAMRAGEASHRAGSSAPTAVGGAPPSVAGPPPPSVSWAGPRPPGAPLTVPPWIWISGIAALLLILGTVIGLTCVGTAEPPRNEEVAPRAHPRPIHPRPRAQPPRRHREDE